MSMDILLRSKIHARYAPLLQDKGARKIQTSIVVISTLAINLYMRHHKTYNLSIFSLHTSTYHKKNITSCHFINSTSCTAKMAYLNITIHQTKLFAPSPFKLPPHAILTIFCDSQVPFHEFRSTPHKQDQRGWEQDQW